MKRFTTMLGGEDIGRSIEVPFDVKAELGRARAPVRVTLNGYAYRTTIAVYGGRFYIPVRREHRKQAGIDSGDRVVVTLALDEAPRIVRAPKELAAALARQPALRAAWDALSYTHKKEHAAAIRAAKRPETGARSVQATLAALKKR